MAEQYIYAVTRIHVNELNLLSERDIQQLVEAGTLGDALRLLHDKGWGAPGIPQNDAEALVDAEIKKTWDLIQEVAGDVAPFDVFRYANDYHNLKAAIKLAYTDSLDGDAERYFVKYGTVAVADIIKAAKEHNFETMPPDMAQAGQAAWAVLAETGNGQACDMVIDIAALQAIDEAGKASESELLRRYAGLTVDSANIKAAMRAAHMGKPLEFIKKAVAPAGSLDAEALAAAAAAGPDAVYEYLLGTGYGDAVPALKRSMADFERWCDNQMIRLIRPQRNNYFGIEPLAAFILGRENEIRMVRLVLSAKQNGFAPEVLQERLREMYV